LTRIVFFHERFQVDESLRPGAPIPRRHEDDSRTVAAVVRRRRIVVKRVSLVAVVVAQDVLRIEARADFARKALLAQVTNARFVTDSD